MVEAGLRPVIARRYGDVAAGERAVLLVTQRARAGDRVMRLDDRFDIKAFHDVVLGSSSVTLPVLRQLVDDWVVS